MFVTGTMDEEAIEELTRRFGNPELISKSLINKLLNYLQLRTTTLPVWGHLWATYTTLKSFDHGAHLKGAANMQLVISGLPSIIAERWTRRKRELQPKDIDLIYLDKWLETEFQVKEMAFRCPNTAETPKQDGGKFRPRWSRSRKTWRVKHLQSHLQAIAWSHNVSNLEERTWRRNFGLWFRYRGATRLDVFT